MRIRGTIGIAVAVWALALTLSVRAHPAATPAAVQAAAPAAQTPPPAQAPANTDCFMCHEDDSAARASGTPVVVKPAVFEASIHGGFGCVDCHQDLATTTDWPHPETLAKVDCATCHTDAVDKFKLGVHAMGRGRGTDVAATCVDCHGSHDIRPSTDPESRTHHLKIAATCSRCHGDADVRARGGLKVDMTLAFGDSIHGRALSRSGLIVAPTCSDCHGAHDILSPKNPDSRVAMGNVPKTCGTCHEGIERQFTAGSHGAMLASGGTAPGCQTCHTAHGIQRSESHAWQLSVIGQCGTCHTERLATFKDTFHGQVTSLGQRAVAGCADCHGAHEILPASDPRSPIAPQNLVKTCGKCHADATENFVKYEPHADKHDRARSPMLFYTYKFMTVLLTSVFAFFGLHTSLWFGKEVRERRERRAVEGRAAAAAARRRRDEGDR